MKSAESADGRLEGEAMALMVVAGIVAVLVGLVLWEWAAGRDGIRDFRVTGRCPRCGMAGIHFAIPRRPAQPYWHCACGWKAGD